MTVAAMDPTMIITGRMRHINVYFNAVFGEAKIRTSQPHQIQFCVTSPTITDMSKKIGLFLLSQLGKALVVSP